MANTVEVEAITVLLGIIYLYFEGNTVAYGTNSVLFGAYKCIWWKTQLYLGGK